MSGDVTLTTMSNELWQVRTSVLQVGISGSHKILHPTEYCEIKLLIPARDTSSGISLHKKLGDKQNNYRARLRPNAMLINTSIEQNLARNIVN